MAGLPSWSKWELVEQFAGINVAKILILLSATGIVAIKAIHDKLDAHQLDSDTVHAELSTEIETASDDLMEQINLNYTASEVNRQIGILELRRDAVQGRLDSVMRALETNPGASDSYREDRDQYQRDLTFIDNELNNLRSISTGSTF